MPNKLSQFWQELKRRNVVRVITVYVAVAFMILEAVDIIFPRVGLPDWTVTLVIFLLAIGLIISIILSWIYDIHPEGGMVKTAPSHKVKEAEFPKSSNSWKIASYISFVVILGLILLNVVPRKSKESVSEILDKSIAVLPFINDSQDQENEHFINGIMEELLINLQTIKELRVPGRTSTEQYRNNPKSIPEIASEMNVAYIVEGSGQRYGDNIRLRVQLVEGATDRHIWADSYEEAINGPEDIFRIQSEIAQTIAAELQAVITPSEKELIEKVATSNLSAYDLYLLGNQYYNSGTNENDLLKAIELYRSAISLDPEFALPYEGIGLTYRRLVWFANWLPAEAFDKARSAALKALQKDDQLAGAHELLGIIHYEFDWDLKASEAELIRAIELNPNKASAYRSLWDLNVAAGRFEVAHQYILRAVSLDPNIRGYQLDLGRSYFIIGEIDSAVSYLEERGPSIQLGQVYLEIGENEKSIEVFEELLGLDYQEAYCLTWLGLGYFRTGRKEKTLEQLELLDNLDSQNTSVSFFRGALLAELGESDSAMHWLQRTYEERNQYLFYYKAYKIPYTSLRSDPRFIEIASRLPTLN